eukprot:CAMPEP_0174717944 /NCGR_PEP_ID=MMETSP1094-20130205/27611_1 /TAXON_ID=156173 /ORGANISM="Chrysochromulina brevifilum, Strain UTEX LB 985" /LENGTH=65 /DNA_ID=CAMNT_0015917951 /DNA_START=177 /DNA_END=374 /DNA_ORIENTATION=-
MTATSILQHAAGGRPDVKGTGMLGFIKYENRAISIAISAALLGGAATVATSDPSIAPSSSQIPTF